MVMKAQKFRLGIFIFTTSMLLIIFLVLVAGKKIMEKRDTYFIRYENKSVTGLQIGGPVKYHGINIGRVDEIKIEKNNVENIVVAIGVNGGTPIKTDVEATLVPIGITGLLQIELIGGSNEADFSTPHSFIKAGNSTFELITGKAEIIATKLEMLLNNFVNITDNENQQKIKNILANVDEMVSENKNAINEIMHNVDDASDDLAALAKNINESAEEINRLLTDGKVEKIITNLDKTTSEFAEVDMAKLLNNADETVRKLTKTIDEISFTHIRSRQDILDIIANLEETVEYLNEFSRQINEDPTLLIIPRNK
jgi:ABC-type transporter Mla subunit MlaD